MAYAYLNLFLYNKTLFFHIVEIADTIERIEQTLEKQNLSKEASSSLSKRLHTLTLDRFLETSNKNYKKELVQVNKSLQRMKEAWEELTFFSNTLKEIGDIVDLKEMIVFEADLHTNVKQIIKEVHNKTLILRQTVENCNYKNNGVKEQKLKLIDEIFIKANVVDLSQKQTNVTDLAENKHFFEGIIIAKKINPKFKKSKG
jgi:hypothetical protein